jgi:hypothetical protein
MPPEELHGLLSTDDPALVHRYLELHRERMEERLAASVETLRRIERSLTDVMPDRV